MFSIWIMAKVMDEKGTLSQARIKVLNRVGNDEFVPREHFDFIPSSP
jgi:hypothetical protein